ncbi:PA2779 family protein [Persephonella sp.]
MLGKVANPVVVLAMALYFLFFNTAPAVAGMVGSVMSDGGTTAQSLREMEINKIQRALENRLVREKLSAYGLSPEQVKERLAQMDDNQIHMLAQASDRVLAGGDLIGTAIGVLIIVLLVVLILKLMGKEIIIA